MRIPEAHNRESTFVSKNLFLEHGKCLTSGTFGQTFATISSGFQFLFSFHKGVQHKVHTNKICVYSEYSDQTAHPRSLTRVIAFPNSV